jgi:hypothetical protein
VGNFVVIEMFLSSGHEFFLLSHRLICSELNSNEKKTRKLEPRRIIEGRKLIGMVAGL